jgi:TRAP-type mannitol/chloroaromatic compound transport system permease small subunit
MSGRCKSFFEVIDNISKRAGKVVSYAAVIIMLITVWEVFSRYVLNQPRSYTWPINRQLFGIFILFAGIYTMSMGGHIRIEILYDFFPPKMKMFTKILTLACFISFMGVLVWQASWMGWNAALSGERFAGAFRIPLYPFKILLPLAAFLFLLEGIYILTRKEPE